METRAKPVSGDPVDAQTFIGRTLGGYRLDAVIGGGGMGIVFEATRTETATIGGPDVAAVKVLSSAFARDPDFVKRFEREADALLALEHDNLIRVFGKGEDDGLYFFVMERFPGEDLRSLMSRGPVDRALAARIIARAAAGLAHAHERGVVHRDVKPANILVRREDDGECVVKVVDFGVAQLAAPDYTLTSLTHSNLILGTVNYMSPEQRIDATAIDRRADIYALGVVAYELLTGRLPIGAFEPPSGLVRSLPTGVDRAVLSALRRDPDQRPGSALEFARRLESALAPSKAWLGVTGGVAVAAAVAAFVVVGMKATDPPVEKAAVVASAKVETPPLEPTNAEPQSEREEDAPPEPVQANEAWTPTQNLVQAADRIRRDVDYLTAPPEITTTKSKVTPRKIEPKKVEPKKVERKPKVVEKKRARTPAPTSKSFDAKAVDLKSLGVKKASSPSSLSLD